MTLFVCILMLALAPVFTTNAYILRILTFACIYSIFAASWDFLAGFVGLLNLGHTAFFGVGAYSAALLNIHFKLPALATIPIGALMGVIAGLVIALPTMRLRAFYLSLVTLAFPAVLSGLIYVFPDFTGGELGIYGVSRIASSSVTIYYCSFAILVITCLVLWKLTDVKSRYVRTGVIFHAIREDEISARASGINTTFYKTLGYCISGFFAGIAGGLYAHFMRIAGPSTLELALAFDGIIWSVVGGLGTIYGAVIGTFLLYPLVEFMRLNPVGEDIRIIVKAVVLIFVLLLMPEGLTLWIRDHLEQECPRCKIPNLRARKICRACRAPLHLERD
jgi:branched-chain amino acid transport system permease protein